VGIAPFDILPMQPLCKVASMTGQCLLRERSKK
jgi:hypothetical protein